MFAVRFWGVRGSIACSSPDHVIYGGNTSCVEVNVDGRVLILDAGTGLRMLGRDLFRRGVKDLTLLFSHTHWDHICGFPFFGPAFVPGFSLRIMAGHLQDKGGIKTILSSQMTDPTFPVPISIMQSSMTFQDFLAGETLDLGDGITVKTAPLRHPNGATGYRISHGGASVCYVTDTEHVPDQPDPAVLDLIAGADLVIYDSMYSDDSFAPKVGWGHSTWQEGIRLCQQAGVKRYAIFHHDPENEDPAMARIEAQAHAIWDRTLVARDGMEVIVRP